MEILPMDAMVKKIEKKYSKCNYCGKKGMCASHPTCFYCGNK